MMIKQVQFQGLEKRAGQFVVNCLPLIDRPMEKTAEAGMMNQAVEKMKSSLHPTVQAFVRTITPTPDGVYVLVNALGAGEYWGSNANGDFFPEKALIHAPANWEQLPQEEMARVGATWPYGFPTFMRAYPYKHHVNKDPSRAFGRVVMAVWNPQMKRVELIVYLDRKLCMQFDAMDVIERIERGEFPDVSMGCRVPGDVCSICEHFSKTTKDYCEHARMWMNKILPDGRKVWVRNDTPAFFDISFVFIGADKTAKVMAKLAQKGQQVCMGDFCSLPRLSADVGAEFSKTASLKDVMAQDPDAEPAEAAYWLFDSLKKRKGMPMSERDAFKAVFREKVANDPIKKKVEYQGVPIWIEWKKGETREYKKNGKVKYTRFMKANYGYIPGTKDSDGEELDVYLGPDKASTSAYVIRQMKKNGGGFDEHKVMIGYSSEEAARKSYDYHMGGTVEFFGGMKRVPVSALRALFGDNDGKEKEASDCGCHGLGDDCGGGLEKFARELFPMTDKKIASHQKVSELIKNIPAGPFTRETLPLLENTERDIPTDVLDSMGQMPLSNALSTPAMAGVVLKPKEFQRVMLGAMGQKGYADELDMKGETFGHSNEIDESVPIGPEHVDARLQTELSNRGIVRDRSAASSALQARAAARSKAQPSPSVSSDPLMKKMAAVYNGYRRSMLKKAAAIQNHLTTDPQLRADLFGSSMAQAFAGGVVKVASTSVLSPDSLAYLVGAYTDREVHLSSKEVVASLALTGAVKEAA
jgi:hypothetical protein